MPPNVFIATLSGSLAQNGSETEVFLSTIQTLTGETITTGLFATFGRGVITVDPLVSTNVEFISFTGVDSSGVGLTGITRGLSALSNSSVTANKKYHPVGAQVIISFGTHNIADILAYVTAAVSGSLGTATDTTAGSTKLSINMGAQARARSTLVAQQASPNMTLLVQPFSMFSGSTQITFLGGSTGTMTAPVSNPRYDLIVYRPIGTTLAIITGTEGVSPSLPTPLSGDIVLASIFHRVGETAIIDRNISPNTQGYIAMWYEPTLYSNSPSVTTSQTFSGVDQSQIISNGTQAVGQANATTKASIIAQRFIPTNPSSSGVSLLKMPDTGTFTGNVKISLQADTSGNPSGTNLASYTIVNAAWLKMASANFNLGSTLIASNLITVVDSSALTTGQLVYLNAVTGITGLTANTIYYLVVVSGTTIGFATSLANAIAGTLITISGTPNTDFMVTNPTFSVNFGAEYESMIIGGNYWIVVTPSTSDNSNHPNLGINTAGGYASGALKFNNSTDGWVLIAVSMLYFQEIEGVLNKIVSTDPISGLIPFQVRPYSFINATTLTSKIGGSGNGGTPIAETIVYSRLIPAGFFTLNSGLKLHLVAACSIGSISGGSGTETASVRVKMNGTTIFTLSKAGLSGTPGGITVAQDMFIVNQNSLGAQYIFIFDNENLSVPGFLTSAIDTSAPIVLEITLQLANTNTSNGDMLAELLGLVLEKIG